MYLPDGVYRGNILIPGIASWITLEIVGESEPTPVWGTIGAFPFQKNGTIVKSLAISDINDPKNLGIGDINYWVVEGNVGAVDKFVKNGGASIRTRRIGSASGGN